LVSEDIENYEGGLKAGVMNGPLTFEASYFQMTEDGVVLSKRQGPFFIPTNAGQRKYKGFETGAGWAASTAMSLYLNAGFYHHRYGDCTIESEDGDTILDGNRLEMSPDHIISLFNEEYYWNGGSEADTADPGRPRQVLVTTALRFK
jgi:outer membrane receptor protein involved in Fe transport